MLLCAHQQKDKHLSMLKMFLKEFFFSVHGDQATELVYRLILRKKNTEALRGKMSNYLVNI